MIREIINKYEKFADSLIMEVKFISSTKGTDSKGSAEVLVHCMNSQKNYEWEVISLKFVDILKFRFIENYNTSSVIINSALLIEEDNRIIVDFFPSIYSHEELVEDPNSDFCIHSKGLEFYKIG